MKAADFAIKHPAVIGMSLITLAFFGALSFRGMNRDLLANITTPEVLIMTIYPGASPEAVEREITDPLEEEFSLIEGVEKISSESHDGYSMIFLTMDWDTDLDAKKNDIRDRINNASSLLPDGIAGNPRLYEIGTSALPVYSCRVESSLKEEDLARYLEEDLVPRFSRIADVSAVYVRGTEAPAVRVRLDTAKLESMDITALDAYAAVSRGQATVPAGDLILGADRLALQSDGDYKNLRQISVQPVGYHEGRPVYLRDVAEVYFGSENAEYQTSSDGKPSVALDVMKRPGGDTESLVESLTELQSVIVRETGGAVRFSPVLDDADTIGITLASVSSSAWFGGLLAVIILLLFLHDLRSALIVTLSIPFTVFLTFILMRARGMTLNIMTLAGVTVSIGMVVDSSIVILENTLRHRRLGLDGRAAASKGADEVGGAVLASTSTSLSVFIPILFVSGLAGAILKEVSWVLIFSLASSAFTAIFIVPWLSARILEGSGGDGVIQAALRNFGAAFEDRFDRLAGAYTRLLEIILDRRRFTLVVSAVLILASFAVLASLGAEMFSAPDMNEFEISVDLPAGYDLDKAESKMEQIAAVVHREVPEIETDLWYTGLGDAATIVETGNPSRGYGRIRLTRAAGRDRSVFDIISHLNRVLSEEITDADITVRNGGLAKKMDYATDGAGFRVELSGTDWNRVLESAAEVAQLMESDPLVVKTSIGVRTDRELLAAEMDRRLAGDLAVDPGQAGMNLRILFAGEEAGILEASDGSYPIFIDSDLSGESMPRGLLGRIRVRNAAGSTVPYSAFTRLVRRGNTDKIPHRDRLPSLVVAANLTDNDLAGIQSRLVPELKALALPSGVSWRVVGAADVMGETFRDLARALGIAIFLVYAVMVVQFERFSQPLIVMGAVPFVLIGVALSLAAFGGKITMMSFFGIIALGGMVVNNAIVLVEFANQERAAGATPRQAILRAARIRLKPILITTLTTLLGLIPLAFAIGEGSEIYAPLGQVIGGGLATSTLITLGLVPVLYEALENRKNGRTKRLARSSGTGTASKALANAVLLGLFFFGPGIGFVEAVDGVNGSPFWTLDDLTALALEDDPALNAARYEARGAEESLKSARRNWGPTLGIELGASYLSDPLISVPAGALGTLPPAMGGAGLPAEDTDVIGQANDFRYDITAVLEQPLFTWGKIRSGTRMAEAGSAAARWNTESRKQELISGLRLSCESLVILRRMRDITKEQEELGRRLAELTLRNFEEGFLLETEYRDTRNRLQQILLTSSSLEKQENDLLLRLERYTGLKNLRYENLDLSSLSTDPLSDPMPGPDELIASAMAANPDLMTLRSLESLSRAELSLAKSNLSVKPDVAFITEFGYGGGFDRAPDNLDGTWTVTIGAKSTLIDSGRSAADIRAAEAGLEASSARVEEGRRELESFIRSSLYAMGLHKKNMDYFAGIRDTDAARATEKKESWETGFGREEAWLLAELDRRAAELQRLREIMSYLALDRQVRTASGLLDEF